MALLLLLAGVGIEAAAAISMDEAKVIGAYPLTTLAIGYAEMPQMPAQLRPANSSREDPDLAAAPPEHVEFVRAHREEILKLTSAIVQARQDGQQAGRR